MKRKCNKAQVSKIKMSENYLRKKHHTEVIARTTHHNFHPPSHNSTLPAVKEHPFPKIMKSDWIWLGEGCRRREARQMETNAQVASSPACSMDPPTPPFSFCSPTFQIATLPCTQLQRFATYSTLGTARHRPPAEGVALRRRSHT